MTHPYEPAMALATKAGQGKVLVTGSTGHLGSWLIHHLLERGYKVRAAVLDPDDKEDMYPLLGIPPKLAENLEIVKADIRIEGDFDEHVQGCDGVFHLACRTTFGAEDPQKDIVEPAVEGTLNVLRSCVKSKTVKRVIHASSMAAIQFTGEPPTQGKVFDESCWTNADFCMKNNIPGWPYFVGKTLGEKAATEFAKEHNLDLVVINPALVAGPFLLPRIPNSCKDFLALVTGEWEKLPFLKRLCYVHINDVARAFIFLYEHPEANGRHICSSVDASIGDLWDLIKSRYPEFKLPADLSYLGEPVINYFSNTKLKNLGFDFEYSLQDMLDDTIKCCREKGLL